jgi:calcineurin-like phosphoesterase family protein
VSKNQRILLIPDMHHPYAHPDTWKFLAAIKRKYKPDRVICLGDEVDGHALSYHESDPDLASAGPELEKAIHFLKPIYKMFPKVDVLESNHGSLVYRKAITAGIPRRALKCYREILEAPKGWHWHFDMRIQMSNGVDLYLHHGKSAKAAELSLNEGCCSAEGHYHTKFHATYWRNSRGLFWGIHCGYLADHDSLAQAYAKSNIKKGIVGAAVILNGQPQMIPMTLKSNGRWVGYL